MITGILTLFNWSLRMDSKSVYPHMIRAGFAFFMLVSISSAFADTFGTTRVGLEYFRAICWLNFLLITAAGVSYFATALTEEKDAGTFALMQLAGMNSLAITLGKSTSRLVSSLMLLVIQLPFTLLAVTLGGILWQQVIAAYLAMAAWMILVANVALFCSAKCATSSRAATMAGLILLLYFGLPPILSAAVVNAGTLRISPNVLMTLKKIPELFETVSPLVRLEELFRAGSYVELFSRQFWLSCLIGSVLFGISTFRLNAWTRPSEFGGADNASGGTRRWPVERTWRVPVAWKDFHFYTGGRSLWIGKFVFGGILMAFFLGLQSLTTGSSSFVLTGELAWQAFLFMAGLYSLEVLMYASGSLYAEVRQMTQSTLSLVPLSPVRILLEKMLGVILASLPSLIWLIVVFVVCYDSIEPRLEAEVVLTFILLMIFSCHVGALFSLYFRWGALPLTVLVSFCAFFCLAAPVLVLDAMTRRLARNYALPLASELSWCVTIFWIWLFVLLPLEIWIRDRWTALTRH